MKKTLLTAIVIAGILLAGRWIVPVRAQQEKARRPLRNRCGRPHASSGLHTSPKRRTARRGYTGTARRDCPLES